MMREHLTFSCDRLQLAGTLDYAEGHTGLLMVSGGNELRSGAFSGMAGLAARIAAQGSPVFRFDRRGVGDSEGENRSFLDSGSDIDAALAAFLQHAPHMGKVVAFGNCDGATALALNARNQFHGLVLSNPWVIETQDAAPPPEAIRARYAEKLRKPHELMRLIKGEVSFGKLATGILQAVRPAPPPSSLADAVRSGIEGFNGPVRILLAERDRTAQVFAASWDKSDPRLLRCAGASHAYAEPESREWLFDVLISALTDEQAGKFHMG